MTQIIKVSKPGYNVLDGALADKDTIFNSELNHLKTAISGSFSQAVSDGTDYTETVAHNLGYFPLGLCYFTDASTSYYKISMGGCPTAYPTRYSVSDINVSMYCDATNMYFKITNSSGGSKTVTVKYEIFYEGSS